MGERNDGGPAFPQTTVDHFGGAPAVNVSGGMTLRDYFAGQALVAMALAAPYSEISDAYMRQVTDQAYAYADQMLIARRL